MKFKDFRYKLVSLIHILLSLNTHCTDAHENCDNLSKASLSTIVDQADRISLATFKLYHLPDKQTKLGNITFTELENLKSKGEKLPKGILKTGPFTSVKNINPGCPFKPNPKLKYLLFLGTQSFKKHVLACLISNKN